MFTAAEIARAGRIVKTASAISPVVAQAMGIPVSSGIAPGTLLNPYAYNTEAFFPHYQHDTWQRPQGPGFLGSLGRSAGGVALMPLNRLRSTFGFAPGRSVVGNIASNVGNVLGGHLWNDPEMLARGSSKMNLKGWGGAWNPVNWASDKQWTQPGERASQQSSELAGTMPKYLEQHAPLLIHPMQTSHEFFKRYGMQSNAD